MDTSLGRTSKLRVGSHHKPAKQCDESDVSSSAPGRASCGVKAKGPRYPFLADASDDEEEAIFLCKGNSRV